YWAWALRVANRWRADLGLLPNPQWARVAHGMRRPALLKEGTYSALAPPPHLVRTAHPSMLMALGWLPASDLIDRQTMAATLDAVWQRWNLQSTWGWDYPVMAMTAAAIGDVPRALRALLLKSPKNAFLPNGHSPQIPGLLSLYLPSNGGLLAAVAHIVAAIHRGGRPPLGWRITAEGVSGPPIAPAPQTDNPTTRH